MLTQNLRGDPAFLLPPRSGLQQGQARRRSHRRGSCRPRASCRSRCRAVPALLSPTRPGLLQGEACGRSVGQGGRRCRRRDLSASGQITQRTGGNDGSPARIVETLEKRLDSNIVSLYTFISVGLVSYSLVLARAFHSTRSWRAPALRRFKSSISDISVRTNSFRFYAKHHVRQTSTGDDYSRTGGGALFFIRFSTKPLGSEDQYS